ncbi:hypothetical protein [Roseateles sp.]|uniref:hypothetical protein n=1 Tax=Roseateles sp. TaxID=1971397 RepID=UPI003D0B6B40
MNLAPHPTPAAQTHEAQGQASHLPAWVARVGQAPQRSFQGSFQVRSTPGSRANGKGGAGIGRNPVTRLLRLLRDPQSWITAIAVLTVVGLSGGAFEAEESHSERSVLHLNSGMTNDAVVAELSSSQR